MTLGKKNSRKSATRSRTAGNRLGCERLESRELMAAGVGITPFDDALRIYTGSGNDSVFISQNVQNANQIEVRVTSNGTREPTRTFNRSEFDHIIAVLNGGDDDYVNNTDILDVVFAGSASSSRGNKIQGGSGQSFLYGGSDRDQLWGRGGDDWLWGGAGNDMLDGGSGNDFLFGGDGPDSLWGQGGNDYLDPGFDNFRDYLYPSASFRTNGETDNDVLVVWHDIQQESGRMYERPPTQSDVVIGFGNSHDTQDRWSNRLVYTNPWGQSYGNGYTWETDMSNYWFRVHVGVLF